MHATNQVPKAPERPAIQQALQWIRSNIAGSAWEEGDALPPLHLLARDASVSRFTMWKAVRILTAEKVLFVQRGSGIFLGHRRKTVPVASHTVAWRSIAERLTQSIYNGEFVPGAILPPLSKLQIRLTTNYRTLRKALELLVERRVLVRTGSHYGVHTVHAPGAKNDVVLFTEAQLDNEQLQAMVPLSEKLAQEIGLRLVRSRWNPDGRFTTLELQRLAARESTVGFIVDYWGANSPERLGNLRSLLAILYASRKPITILDEVGNLDVPEPLRSSKRMRTLTIAARVAGEDVGRHLLHSGHRHIAYLTLMPDRHWSQQRYLGLQAAFSEAMIFEQSVVFVTTEPIPDMATIVCAASQLTDKDQATLFPEHSRNELERLSAASAETHRKLGLRLSEVRRIREQVMPIVRLFRTSVDQRFATAIRAQYFHMIGGQQLVLQLLQPMFQRLLADPSISAWVSSTDGTALAAQSFLQERSIKVPAQISLYGFDNSLQATIEGLTSYDFDISGMLKQALSFVSGRTDRGLSAKRVIEWPGRLIVRETTGPRSR